MSHYTLGAHQAHVSQQYISYLLLVNHIITPHYRNLLGDISFHNHSSTVQRCRKADHAVIRIQHVIRIQN